MLLLFLDLIIINNIRLDLCVSVILHDFIYIQQVITNNNNMQSGQQT